MNRKKVTSKSKKLKNSKLKKLDLNVKIITVVSAVLLVGVLGSLFLTQSNAASLLKIKSISPSSGDIGTNINITTNLPFKKNKNRQFSVTINGIPNVAVAKSINGGRTASFTFPSTLCPLGKMCAQVLPTPGKYKISIVGKNNTKSNSKIFNLTPQLSNNAFFEYSFKKDGLKTSYPDTTFIVEFNDQNQINQARESLKGVGQKLHFSGKIIKGAASYNPNWQYHVDPNTISLGALYPEVCDAHPFYVAENLDAIGGSFLPDNMWCPWSSELSREVYLKNLFNIRPK